MRLRRLLQSLDWPSFRPLIRVILGSLASAAAGSALVAQTTTLSVRGGEHADFTRLVIHLPDENHWRLGQSGRNATLQVTGPPLQFDLAQTFARIPRTRLRNIVAQPDALVLELACDCDVRASEDIPQFLVIDIIGSSDRTPEPARAMLRPKPRPQSADPPRTDGAYRAGQALARTLRDGRARSSESTSLTLGQLFDTLQIAPSDPASEDGPQPLARSALTDEIGRALSESVAVGLLQGNEAFTRGDRIPDMDQQSEGGAELGTPDAHVSFAPSGRDGPARETRSTENGHESCRDSELLETALWEQSIPPDAGIFAVARLYGERDLPDPERIRDLARHLLYLGFGAEARMALQLHPEPSRDAPLLGQIGYLVDLEPAPEPGSIMALNGCSPMSTLWAFLAAPTDRDGMALHTDMLTLAVQSLPPHLRIHLGPAVIQRLTLQGQREAAQLVRDAVDRVAQTPTPALRLAQVTLDLETGTSEAQARTEARLAPEQSDDALLFLLDRREREGRTLDPTLLELAQDRLLALRGTQQGQHVAGHVLRAMLRAHAFHDAWEFLDQRPAPLRDAHHLAAYEDLLRAMTQQAEDPVFLTLVFAQRPWHASGLDPALRDAVADRLAALGFPEQSALMRLQQEQSPLPAPLFELDEPATRGEDAGSSGPMPTMAQTNSQTGTPPAPPVTTQATAPLSRDTEARALDRARAEQARLAEAREDAARPTVPDTLTRQAAELALQDETTPPTDTGAAGPPAPQATAPSRTVSDQASAIGAEGLLGQSRAALSESAALRERLQSMLNIPETP